MTTKIVLLPDYQNPDGRSTMGRWTDSIYLRNRAELQAILNKHPLSDALRLLHAQQMDSGFIIDDLTAVRYFQCHGGDDAFFIGQYNPNRRLRFKGNGRVTPPEGVATKTTRSTKCFICHENVGWQSRGVQFYFLFDVNGNSYAALCNPFPFMPTHMTIASTEHAPQSWHGKPEEELGKMTRIVTDLYDLAVKLPEWICFYNGVGAGASIEEHLHFQAFMSPAGHGLFPIQHAARRIEQKANESIGTPADDISPSVLVVDTQHYPLTTFRITGNRENTIRATIGRMREWSNTVGNAASANLIAIHEKSQVTFYLVPRNYRYSRSAGLQGIVGGMEVMGEFILSTPEEDAAINSGEITFQRMWSILKGVNPPNVSRMTTH
ncbi:MAG: DUF4922 domain-containing protein [Candidatus Moranbacteria bacterium]|jgi:hypothetical protein|nr:DUF4922 domain-containing protein [Candidatus Moranbacteria bacterium]MBP9801356.1 DUF4922 domain-containing protein [Candidatus Moranbacteria bacterium]